MAYDDYYDDDERGSFFGALLMMLIGGIIATIAFDAYGQYYSPSDMSCSLARSPAQSFLQSLGGFSVRFTARSSGHSRTMLLRIWCWAARHS